MRRLLSDDRDQREHVTMLDQAWVISPAVALRPEPFGALAYHFGNRKLTFLKNPLLVLVVESLGDHPDARTALAAAGVAERDHTAYAAALEGLAKVDMIRPRPADIPGADR